MKRLKLWMQAVKNDWLAILLGGIIGGVIVCLFMAYKNEKDFFLKLYEQTTTLIGVVAWPIITLVLIRKFEGSVKSLVERAYSLNFKTGEVKLAEEFALAKKAVRQAEGARKSEDPKATSAVSSDKRVRSEEQISFLMEKLHEKDLVFFVGRSVINALAPIEDKITDLAKAYNLSDDQKITMLSDSGRELDGLLKGLCEEGAISESTIQAINKVIGLGKGILFIRPLRSVTPKVLWEYETLAREVLDLL